MRVPVPRKIIVREYNKEKPLIRKQYIYYFKGFTLRFHRYIKEERPNTYNSFKIVQSWEYRNPINTNIERSQFRVPREVDKEAFKKLQDKLIISHSSGLNSVGSYKIKLTGKK